MGNVSGYEKGFVLGVQRGAEINQQVLAACVILMKFIEK